MASLIPAIGVCVSTTTGYSGTTYRTVRAMSIPTLSSSNRAVACWCSRLRTGSWAIRKIDRQSVVAITPNGLKRQGNTLEQARQYLHETVDVLKRDPQLTCNSDRQQGTVLFVWGYGVVLVNITRNQFERRPRRDFRRAPCHLQRRSG